MDQPFVEALNKLMAGNGISNNELARRIEVDPAQIGRWRKGNGRPRPENLVRVAGVFNVDYRWLWALAYPEGVPEATGPDDEDLAMSATMAEMRDILRGLPRAYWGTVLKAFSRGVEGARDMAQLLTEQPTPANTVSTPAHTALSRSKRPTNSRKGSDDEELAKSYPVLRVGRRAMLVGV